MIRERRECDVFGTAKGVEAFRVKIFRYDSSGEPVEEASESALRDLSPRALVRLYKFIERGLSKPSTSAAE